MALFDTALKETSFLAREARQTTKTLSNVGVKLERVTAGRYENLGTFYTGRDGTYTWNQLEAGWYRITKTPSLLVAPEATRPLLVSRTSYLAPSTGSPFARRVIVKVLWG